MSRPWYTYALLFLGILSLLAALFRPMAGASSAEPGAVAHGPEHRLVVAPAGPLERAGIRSGDRFQRGQYVVLGGTPGDEVRPLRWRREFPRTGEVRVLRGDSPVEVIVNPAPPRPLLRLVWLLVALLNMGLVALALALFWQRPREAPAVLLGMVLLAAPVFSYPGEPRVAALVFAAHFFTIFPTAAPQSRLRRGALLALALYVPALLGGLVGSALSEAGRAREAGTILSGMAVSLAAYSLARVLARWRCAPEAQREVYRALALAAGAILAAVLVGISERFWLVRNQLIPANLPAAVLFSVAVTRMVFRLRVLEVRLVARRTLQYLLARWTLGTLFLIPGFVLVWRFGQLSVTGSQAPGGEVLLYLAWMLVAAVLLGHRRTVLRRLDRRFFRDLEAAQLALAQLARELAGLPTEAAVTAALVRGAAAALNPERAAWGPSAGAPPFAAELSVPLRRGEALYGWLHMGPKQNGDRYSDEERQLLEAAAAQAAVEIANLRLNAALLEQQRAEFTARSAGLVAGAEEERRRLAADLHDQVLPELRHVAGEAARLRERSDGLAPELARLEGEVRATMHSVREVMEALRPSALDILGLGDALEALVRAAAARHGPPLGISVRRTGPEPALPGDASLGLYRIIQEGVNNVVLHSGATRAGLEMECAPHELRLLLWDDGRGFDPSAAPGAGRGLANIRYRADLIGAAVEWLPREGGGTCLTVRLPLPRGAANTPVEGSHAPARERAAGAFDAGPPPPGGA